MRITVDVWVEFVEGLEHRRLLSGSGPGSYHDYASLAATLRSLANAFPSITQMVSIGKSVQNRNLWALKITDNPTAQEDEPEFKYIGAMHGDEPVGQEMTLYLASHLLGNYGVDPTITTLINETEIWLLPNMNPDGLALNQRENANGIDLNRDFPEGVASNIGNLFDGPALPTSGHQPETLAVMNWSAGQRFSLSANLHGGSMVVNYPYDTNNNGYPDYAATPDDKLFKELALTYSRLNPPLYASDVFPQGISNGDDWYEVDGGMQDWNYRYTGNNEVTIELSDDKKPPASHLPEMWNDNRYSMLAYLKAVHWGIRGIITRTTDGHAVHAKIKVSGNAHAIYADADIGDYHRLLLPGTYSITVSAPGYDSRTVENIRVTSLTGEPTATVRLDVALKPTDTSPPTLTYGYGNTELRQALLNLRFSEQVVGPISPEDFTLLDQKGRVVEVGLEEAMPSGKFDRAFRLRDGPLADGNYRVSVSLRHLRDVWGNRGKGSGEFSFYVLAADANGDRRVDESDSLTLRRNFGLTGRTLSDGDLDYSRTIDSKDFSLLCRQMGKLLPAPAAAAMSSAVFASAPTPTEMDWEW